MKPTLCDSHLFFIKGIDYAVFLVDAPGPIAFKVKFQWFRFACALSGTFTDFKAQLYNFPQHLGIVLLPPIQIF